jgi:zinc transport system substrate-binding protein
MLQRPFTLLAVTVLITATLTACGSSPKDASGKLDVVAALYPLEWISKQVGGDQVTTMNLVKPGAEPHDLELTAKLVAAVSDAKLVVYLPGFQPAVDSAVSQHAVGRSFDVAAVQPLAALSRGGRNHSEVDNPFEDSSKLAKDPHVWLDPIRLAKISDSLADRFARIDPTHAQAYQQRAAALRTELETIDKEYSEGLKTCQRHELVTSHAAFGYLADRYQLEQISIAGLSPDQEPSAQRITDIINQARAHQATTIFTEALISPKIAKTIAEGSGAKTEVLDPIESPPGGNSDDYPKIMRENLVKLRSALGCS